MDKLTELALKQLGEKIEKLDTRIKKSRAKYGR